MSASRRNGTCGAPGVCPSLVESRCGAAALGRTYLLPPLSSGGASVVRPWLRFHTPLIGSEAARLGAQIDKFRAACPTFRPEQPTGEARALKGIGAALGATPELDVARDYD